MSEYHIQKTRRRIVVKTHSGEKFVGDMHLQSYGRYGGGAERPIDVLNAAEQFFPLSTVDGDTVLIAKDQVVAVTCDEANDDDEAEHPLTHRVAVEVCLVTGESLPATVLLEVPDDHPRLLDYLNLRKHRFLPMKNEEGQLLINRSSIERVRSVAR